jgi:hypothetical protein
MSADSDYARVVELLTKQNLAPYVSYLASDRVTGLAHDADSHRIVVRTSDGKIVAGSSHLDVGTDSAPVSHNTNPVGKPAFNARCYHATSEVQSTYNGTPALAIALAPACGTAHEYPFTTLYADAQTLRPLDVYGNVPMEDDAKSVKVSLDQSFATFDGRSMPAELHVDVKGTGFMFWLHVHVTEIYSDYRFLSDYTP